MNFEIFKKSVNLRTAEWNAVRRRVVTDKEEYDKAKAETQHAIQAQELAQVVAKQIQEAAHSSIAGVVSECLSAVFEDPYEFKINFRQLRGKTEANLVFERNGIAYDPMDASGGGVVDLAAFALKLSCLMLSQPPVRKVMILDEPLKFLSEEYREKVRELIERLSKDTGVQFIIVTHIKELQTGKLVSL